MRAVLLAMSALMVMSALPPRAFADWDDRGRGHGRWEHERREERRERWEHDRYRQRYYGERGPGYYAPPPVYYAPPPRPYYAPPPYAPPGVSLFVPFR